MSPNIQTDHNKISEALRYMRKSIQCTLCHKIPTEPTAAKCGHPFCKACVNTVLSRKRSVCGVCKTTITKNGLYDAKYILNIAEDLNSLCKAVEKDSDIPVVLDKQPTRRQVQGKRKSLTLPGPSVTETTIQGESGLQDGQNKRRASVDSEETIKIHPRAKSAVIISDVILAAPSTSRATTNIGKPLSTVDTLSIKIGAIGTEEKVGDWLKSQEFKDGIEDEPETEPAFDKIVELSNPSSTLATKIIKSFSQTCEDSNNSAKNGRNSRAGNTSDGRIEREGSSSTDNEMKFRSFTTQAINDRKKLSHQKTSDESRRTPDNVNENKKAKAAVSTEESWSDLALLKKETRAKVRKRKRLNISIERPSTSKSVTHHSEEAQNEESMENEGGQTTEKMIVSSGSKEKKLKQNLVMSSSTLGEGELLDLSRRELMDIIGACNTSGNLDNSKKSNNSSDKSTPTLNKSKPSLNKSAERSKDRSNADGESSRPQSKLGTHADNSRPGSRLSCKSGSERESKKFELSVTRKSSTPVTSPSRSSMLHSTPMQNQEKQEKIDLSHDTSVRTCNDFMRKKLSIKRLSSGSSKGSANVSIKKLGRLVKTKKRFKFYRLGSISSDLPRECSTVTQHSFGVQTSPSLLDRYFTEFVEEHNIQIPSNREPESRTAAASTSETSATNENCEEFDTANKVNMLSPEKDSQLKYLSTESPSAPKIVLQDGMKNTGKPVAAITTEHNSPNLEFNKYLRAVNNDAEKLIVTDSEDQDTPNTTIRFTKRKNICEAEKNVMGERVPSSTTSLVSKSASTLSDLKTNADEIGATTNPEVVIENFYSSSPNKLEKILPLPSPRREKYPRNSRGSQSKIQSSEKPKSQSNLSGNSVRNSAQSNAETVVHNNAIGKADSKNSEISSRHKVARKLKYSQESGSKENGESSKQQEKKNARSKGKKTFQRIQQYSSSDSENDCLEISLTTKQSSSNSQTISRPEPSREKAKSPILSEDLTIVFSSERDTQESKRKRSPSPSLLDNDAIQAIASNWCADLDRSSEEIAASHNSLLGKAKNVSVRAEATPKKARTESFDSPISDNFPALSPTAIYGRTRNRNIIGGGASISDNENMQIDTLEEQEETGKNSAPTKTSMKYIRPAADTEISSINGTINRVSSRSINSTPIQIQAFEERSQSAITQISHNSDKENGLNAFEDICEDSERRNSDKTIRNSNPPSKGNVTNNTQPGDYESDGMNITQEELLLQEVEKNLGINTVKNNKQTTGKCASRDEARSTKGATDKLDTKARGYQIAEIHSDDSDIADEEIVERTPEKIAPFKRDLYSFADNSQRSNISMKSFMSVDMTPIARKMPRNLQQRSVISPLVETSGRPKPNNNLNVPKSQYNTRHSTPKALPPRISNLNTAKKSARRLCFVCSSLTPTQIQNVKQFALRHNAEFTVEYKPAVTHVIVETDDSNCAGRTLKYLQGVANKNWIVSFQWVKDSVTKGRLLDEEKYEVLDRETDEPGPRRSRLSEMKLFQDFAFVCMKPFTDITSKQLQDLLLSTGGTVKNTLEELASTSNKYRVIIYNSDIHKLSVLENWYRRGAAMPVQIEWVLSCISQYQLTSFRECLQGFDPDMALKLGFPNDLILEDQNSSGANDSGTAIES